jgi:PDZ domain-containing protein
VRFSPLPRFALLILALFTALALVAPLPFVIILPGGSQNIFDKIISVKNQKSYPATGRLDLMSIRVTNPDSWIIGPEIAYSWMKSDEAVYPRSAIYPQGTTAKSEDKTAKADMTNSQNNAITAALSFLRLHPEYGASTNILSEKNISFDVKRTGGPSGGTVFAIGVIELLTKKDLLKGRHVAATGTITTDGKIGAIGGINEKILAAKRAGAILFLAPSGNREEIAHIPNGIKIAIVSSLAEAIKALN